MPVIPSDPKTPSQPHGSSSDSSNSQDQVSNKPSILDHISKGPQIPDNMPPKASREEVESRMKELNKS